MQYMKVAFLAGSTKHKLASGVCGRLLVSNDLCGRRCAPPVNAGLTVRTSKSLREVPQSK